MLREKIELSKKNELSLQREKKTLLLSLSYDIKTPLSAIKLYAKALSKGLYKDTSKQLEIAEAINDKAGEIESFVNDIIKASSDDFLHIEVNNGEFYLSSVIRKINEYSNLFFQSVFYCLDSNTETVISKITNIKLWPSRKCRTLRLSWCCCINKSFLS